MSPFDAVMEFYPYVFHPSVMVGGGLLVLLYREWERQGADRSTLWRRVGAFLVAGLSSFVPTLVYATVTGQGLFAVTKGNKWQVDALVAGGIFFTAAVTWLVWRHYDWGTLVPAYLQALVVATIPYIALSPGWNFSGHVAMSLMPTLYLTLVDSRYAPTLAIPIVMVPNRLYLDAHTWPETIGAFLTIAALVAAVYWWQTGGEFRAEPGSAVS